MNATDHVENHCFQRILDVVGNKVVSILCQSFLRHRVRSLLLGYVSNEKTISLFRTDITSRFLLNFFLPWPISNKIKVTVFQFHG